MKNSNKEEIDIDNITGLNDLMRTLSFLIMCDINGANNGICNKILKTIKMEQSNERI